MLFGEVETLKGMRLQQWTRHLMSSHVVSEHPRRKDFYYFAIIIVIIHIHECPTTYLIQFSSVAGDLHTSILDLYL